MPFSNGYEPALIDRLREEGVLALSLVAELDGKIVGHIAFSQATAADASAGWYALGPVSAEPSLQRQGIGSKLVKTGLEILQKEGAKGCVLVGNPDYYRRFAFVVSPELAPPGQPKDFYQMLSFNDSEPSTHVDFHPIFAG